MKRRSFIKKLGLAAAGAVAAPYILPSGRLFARTGARLADHVVVCLFAGGVRNLESVHKAEGNLMPNILTGTEPISPDILPGLDAVPPPVLSPALQTYGTLYKEYRHADGPTGHYSAHSTALTGVYNNTDLTIKDPPRYPTVFELYRKHSSPTRSALNAWWVSNQLGPYPALNYSSYPGYGSEWGANYIQPLSLISQQGYDVLGHMKPYSTQQFAQKESIRDFLNAGFSGQTDPNLSGIFNPVNDADLLRAYIAQTLTNAAAGMYANPWVVPGGMSGDMYNLFFATEILTQFKPELLVVNMTDVDVAHFNYTDYCNNLRKADYAVGKLWNHIQSTPGMSNNTVLIVVPEHGRNYQANTLIDPYGRYALDHSAIGTTSGDQMAREMFCLIAGPPGVVVQNQVITQVMGESIDLVPTVAGILGFDADIPPDVYPGGSFLGDAFI